MAIIVPIGEGPVGRRHKQLAAIPANAGIASTIEERLLRQVDEMNRSSEYWLTGKYRSDPPATIAEDESSGAALLRAIQGLRRRWERRFADLAADPSTPATVVRTRAPRARTERWKKTPTSPCP